MEGWYLLWSRCNGNEKQKAITTINRIGGKVIDVEKDYVEFTATQRQADEVYDNAMCAEGMMTNMYPLICTSMFK